MRIALFVTIDLKKESKDDYLMLIHQHQSKCPKIEKGCKQFDVLIPEKPENRVHLFEVFENEAALDLHINTGYMAIYRENSEPMLTNKVLNRCTISSGGTSP